MGGMHSCGLEGRNDECFFDYRVPSAVRVTMATKYEWEITYHEALLETDWAKIEARIQAAEAAMKTKLNDFSLNHGGTPQENHAIEDAMNALNVLKREVVVWRERRAG